MLGPGSQDVVSLRLALIELLRQRGETARALPLARAALADLDRGADPALRFTVLLELGMLFVQDGQAMAAQRYAEQARVPAERAGAGRLAPLEELAILQASILRTRGDATRAFAAATAALQAAEGRDVPDPALSGLEAEAALAAVQMGPDDVAVAAARRALEIEEARLGRNHPALLVALRVHEHVLHVTRQKREARRVSERIRMLVP